MTAEALMVAAAQRIAREAEEGMEEIARRRTAIAARLEVLDRQVQWVMTNLREAGATAAEVAAQLGQIRDEQARLRTELEPLAARMALCQADLPRAQEVQAICREFVAAAQGADACTKRALLDAVECSVLVDSDHFRIEGVLSMLGLEGEIGAQTTESSW
jgi:chromosome segregation ATPase